MNLVFSKDILVIKDIQNLTKLLENFIRKQTFEDYRKRGIIIGISGGIDSAVAAALACNAVGNENVLGIILPEKESNRESQELAKTLCNKEPPKRFKCSGVKKKTAKHKLETKVKMKAGKSLRARLI